MTFCSCYWKKPHHNPPQTPNQTTHHGNCRPPHKEKAELSQILHSGHPKICSLPSIKVKLSLQNKAEGSVLTRYYHLLALYFKNCCLKTTKLGIFSFLIFTRQYQMLIKTSSINWKGSINISITKTGPETLFCSAGEEKETPLKSSKQKKKKQ